MIIESAGSISANRPRLKPSAHLLLKLRHRIQHRRQRSRGSPTSSISTARSGKNILLFQNLLAAPGLPRTRVLAASTPFKNGAAGHEMPAVFHRGNSGSPPCSRVEKHPRKRRKPDASAEFSPSNGRLRNHPVDLVGAGSVLRHCRKQTPRANPDQERKIFLRILPHAA